ncbi:MAG: hypothetical protein LBV67_00420, partial [Streptococcaceae bacterium]|nr:hypothetical protein [Streptococcaceae bacterium]
DSIELANKLTSENILTYGANGTVFFDYDRAIAIGLDKELANEFQKLARSSQLRGKVSVVLKLGPQAKQMGAIAGVALASSYAAGAFSALLAVSPIAYGALIAVFAGCVGAAWGVPTITVSVDVPLVSWTKTIQLP